MRLPAILVASLVLTAPVFGQAALEDAPVQTAPHGGSVPDLLKRALSSPSSNQLFAYDFEDVIVDRDGKRTVRGRIDPSRPKGDRVTITFLEDLRRRPADLESTDKRYEKNADGDIFCDTASREDVTNVVDKGEAPGGGRVFEFQPNPEPHAERMIKELAPKMSARAVVDEVAGHLRSFTATLTRKHSVNLFGQVKSATYSAQCDALPNGRAYTSRINLDALISAMGSTYKQETVQVISNVTPTG